MAIYKVHWVEKINVWAENVEADSPEEAVRIAKSTPLDVDTDPHSSKPTGHWAEETDK